MMRAFINDPDVVLIDGPTNHLDLKGKVDLENELKDQSLTMIFVSHDRRFVREVANRYFQISDGVLEEISSLS